MVRTWIGSIALAAVLAVPAAAGAQTKPLAGGDDTTLLAAAGVTFLNSSSSTGAGAAANVLFNTLTTTDMGRIGLVADLGFNRADGATTSTIMGGARYTFDTNGRVVPYGQFLAGILHAPGVTHFDPAIGFGLDVAWRPQVNFRGELQFIFDDTHATRFFFGVSMPIKKKR